jgi:hypothetical protein
MNKEGSLFLNYTLRPYLKSELLAKAIFVVISLFFFPIILWEFIFFSFKKLLHPNRTTKKINNIYINASAPNEFEIGLTKNLFKSDILILEFPYLMKKYEVNKVRIEQILGYKSYFKALCYSIYSSFFLFFKYGLNGGFYGITSYRFFLMYEFLKTLPENTNIFFNNQKDRWALLFDSISGLRKNLIQHGTNIVRSRQELSNKFLSYDADRNLYYIDMPFKLKNIDTLYAFSADEVKYILLGEQEPKKDLNIEIIGYPINLSTIEKNNNKRSLLIVGCCDLYFSEEVQILSLIDFEKWRVFLKPHPTMGTKNYQKLNKYHIELIGGRYFPDVDLVFSYSSTLAFEYESCGKQVIYYDDIREENSMKISKFKVLTVLAQC